MAARPTAPPGNRTGYLYFWPNDLAAVRFGLIALRTTIDSLERMARMPLTTRGALDLDLADCRRAEKALAALATQMMGRAVSRRELKALEREHRRLEALTPEMTTTPEMTLREAGISDHRQSEYQRRMSRLLGKGDG